MTDLVRAVEAAMRDVPELLDGWDPPLFMDDLPAMAAVAVRMCVEACALALTRNKFHGGFVYPHMCSSCGLSDEEMEETRRQQKLLEHAATVLRALAPKRPTP